MATSGKKELTAKEIKYQSIHNMLESMISGKTSDAEAHLHDYLQVKTQELILGEKHKDDDACEKCECDPCECDDDDKKDKDDDKKDDKRFDFKKKDKKDDKKEKVDESTLAKAFANSGVVMDDKVKGDIKFDNGGKKTLKKHGNASKELEDDVKGKVKFKNGGKQPAKTLEKTPKPEKFDDGRDRDLGTAKS